jgi:hypothetical protein
MLWHFLCKCEGPTPPRGDAKKDQGLPGLGGLVRADSDRSWVLDQRQVDIHHQLDEVFELSLRLPAQLDVDPLRKPGSPSGPDPRPSQRKFASVTSLDS